MQATQQLHHLGRVHERGYHCTGEMLPKHLCAPEDLPDNGPGKP